VSENTVTSLIPLSNMTLESGVSCLPCAVGVCGGRGSGRGEGPCHLPRAEGRVREAHGRMKAECLGGRCRLVSGQRRDERGGGGAVQEGLERLVVLEEAEVRAGQVQRVQRGPDERRLLE
jgi:hypothetical protein